MLHTFAERLTDKLFLACRLEERKRQVYVYGIELSLSTASSLFSILVLSACFSILPSAVIFLLFFCSLRSYVGGYHAKTYGRCFVLTNAVYGSVIVFTYLLNRLATETVGTAICCLLGTVSIGVMVLFAPIRNINHPLSAKRYARNRRIARVLASICALVLSILFLLVPGSYYFYLIPVTLAAVAAMMIIPKLQERRA